MRGQARALALATHPAPSLAVTLIVVLLAAGAELDPWRIALLGAVLLLNQASVGLSNDWLDAERDRAVGRIDKPVALGLVPVPTVRAVAVAAAIGSLLLSLPLGAAAALAHAVFLTAGWSYNVWLKRTVLSVVPYAVGFGSLPALVTLSAADPRPAAWWAMLAGAALGVAAHFANVLPDLDDDAQTGVRGLPHRLGRRASEAVTWSTLVAAAALVTVGGGSPVAIGGLVGVTAIAAVGLTLGRAAARRGDPAPRASFRLILLAAMLVVLLLALGGGAVLG